MFPVWTGPGCRLGHSVLGKQPPHSVLLVSDLQRRQDVCAVMDSCCGVNRELQPPFGLSSCQSAWGQVTLGGPGKKGAQIQHPRATNAPWSRRSRHRNRNASEQLPTEEEKGLALYSPWTPRYLGVRPYPPSAATATGCVQLMCMTDS